MLNEQIQSAVSCYRPWITLAGLFGATAVMLGAYGTHGLQPRTDVPDERKHIFETANKYHFYHTFALFAIFLAKRPPITGLLFALGTLVFCGTCYYYAITGDVRVIRFTPWGGWTIIFAWISLAIPIRSTDQP